jgi:hypothetical protein
MTALRSALVELLMRISLSPHNSALDVRGHYTTASDQTGLSVGELLRFSPRMDRKMLDAPLSQVQNGTSKNLQAVLEALHS